MLTILLTLLSLDSTTVRRIAVAPTDTLSLTLAGTGRPVVLINGLIGGAFGFRKLLPGLTESGHQVIAVEQLGTGWASRPSRADYSLAAQADRIAAALDSIDVRHAVVVAHSLGAAIALRLAYRRPDLVQAMVLIDGGAAESASSPGLRRAMKWAPLLKLFITQGRLKREVRDRLLENSADSSWLTPEVLEGYTAPGARNLGKTIDALHGVARSREPESLIPHLPEIQVPVALLVGATPHPAAMAVAESEALRDHLPHFTLDSVPACGQLVHEERPEAVLLAVARVEASAAPPPD